MCNLLQMSISFGKHCNGNGKAYRGLKPMPLAIFMPVALIFAQC
jgi:hypothetical protein